MAEAMIEPVTSRTRQTTPRRRLLPFLAALVAILATTFGAATASAATPGGAETRVRAPGVGAGVLVGPPNHVSAGQQLGDDVAGPEIVVATGVAANGGANAVRLGQAGENAVRGL